MIWKDDVISENSIDVSEKSCISSGSEIDIEHLVNLRKTYINNPIVAYYNINSLRNKIHDIREIILKFLPDLLVLAETKIDKNFPIQQFLINE